jgi:ATP-dependent protease HslVU (ClpYQ) peptidase subunit
VTASLSDQQAEALPMTLLGAVEDGDSIIVGADSIVTRSDGMGSASFEGTTIKFRQLRDTQALYGYYGSQNVGEPIGAQLEASTRWGKWSELPRVAADLIRQVSTAPGFPKHELTRIMIAGYIEGEPAIHRICEYGQQEAQETPAFLGNGRVAAKVGWQIAQEANADMSVEDRFRLVMRTTVAEVVPLGPPIRYWRVTTESIEPLDDDDWEAKYPWSRSS